jgi:hypothetical protein
MAREGLAGVERIVVVTNDTPAARAFFWGSDYEFARFGNVVAAKPAVRFLFHMGEGSLWRCVNANPPPAEIIRRVWNFTPDVIDLGDWVQDGTREMLRALSDAARVRVFLWRPVATRETMADFNLRWRAAIGVIRKPAEDGP